MEFLEKIKALAARVEKQKASILTEEACKNAFVMPFLNALGYDVFNPEIVVPEFTADFGVKKGEKVDYAIKLNGVITMLVECKPCGSDLAQQHTSQLYRYFSVTDARFSILTNGLNYWFYSDLDETNCMDQRPFFRFDILDHRPSDIAELSKFTQDQFDLDRILTTASTLKYSSAIQQEFARELEEPSDEMIKLFASRVYDGHFTKRVRDEFREIVANAFKESIRDVVNKRLASALQATSESSTPETQNDAGEEKVVTTQDELEAFHIVKSIVRTVVKADRVVMRDSKSYCAILLDDNNRKTIARLHFNRSKKYIGLFSSKQEERVPIAALEDIYEHAERLQGTVREYDAQNRHQGKNAVSGHRPRAAISRACRSVTSCPTTARSHGLSSRAIPWNFLASHGPQSRTLDRRPSFLHRSWWRFGSALRFGPWRSGAVDRGALVRCAAARWCPCL